jgi:hypothetical protein
LKKPVAQLAASLLNQDAGNSATGSKIGQMNTPHPHALSRALLMAALICAAGLARAQGNVPPAPVAPPPAATASGAAEPNLLDRKTQKVEHLHFEDNGNRVDEIRSGGQTQRITVQPKDGAPAYEVMPASPNATNPDGGIGQTGPRVWRIHQF